MLRGPHNNLWEGRPHVAAAIWPCRCLYTVIQLGVLKTCGVNKCPYLDPPHRERVQSSSSTWHALIFVLLCNAVSVVLTALLPSLLQHNDIRRSMQSLTALPVFRSRAMPLGDGEPRDGYRTVGLGTCAAESMRRKTLTTLHLFTDRRLLMLSPTIIVTGLTGSLTVAAFHQVRRRSITSY